jgi:cytochrome c553
MFRLHAWCFARGRAISAQMLRGSACRRQHCCGMVVEARKGIGSALLDLLRSTLSPDRRLVMMRVVPFAVAFVFLASLASAQGNAEKGKEVYTAQKCSICHSVAGVGNKKGPLDDVGSKLSAGDIRSWITSAPDQATKAKAERKPAMKAYTLSKDDLDNLVAYLQALKK